MLYVIAEKDQLQRSQQQRNQQQSYDPPTIPWSQQSLPVWCGSMAFLLFFILVHSFLDLFRGRLTQKQCKKYKLIGYYCQHQKSGSFDCYAHSLTCVLLEKGHLAAPNCRMIIFYDLAATLCIPSNNQDDWGKFGNAWRVACSSLQFLVIKLIFHIPYLAIKTAYTKSQNCI